MLYNYKHFGSVDLHNYAVGTESAPRSCDTPTMHIWHPLVTWYNKFGCLSAYLIISMNYLKFKFGQCSAYSI